MFPKYSFKVSGLPVLTQLRKSFALISVLVMTGSLNAQVHPRLLFGPEDLADLRAKTTIEPYATMFNLLMADAETGQYGIYEGPTPEQPDLAYDPYGECINGMRLGFLYLLTGDDYYAERARFYVENRIHDDTYYRWGNSSQKGLNLYFTGKSVAMIYDWCFGAPSWDTAFSAEVSAALLVQGNVIADSGGSEQNTNSASNWQGLRGSSAVLCFLATDEAYDSTRYSKMYSKTRSYLRDNMGTGVDSRGWNIEGIGYLGYPYATVIPAVVSSKRDNPSNDMVSDLPAIEYGLWTQYAATVRFHRGNDVWLVHPDFGDDNATADDANGMYGYAFLFSKPSLIPGLKYWYDRLLVPENNWDSSRAGTIFSFLHYPADVTEVPPLQIDDWRAGFLDTGGNGFFTFRNQYENTDDLVSQLYVKLRGNKGHSGPDALSFRILGLNTAWAVGGGRYGAKVNGQDAYLRSQNTLYPVDPEAPLSINSNSGSVVGTPTIDAFGGGQVVSQISQNNVGTSGQKRWFASDYSGDAGVDAVYVIADTSYDGFFWQYNTLNENTITTGDHWFMITGQDGATLKGTVLYPNEPVEFTVGNRIRGSYFAYGMYGDSNNYLHFRGAGDYLVVLTVAKEGQTHPTVSQLAGRVVGASIDVGGKIFGVDTDHIVFGSQIPNNTQAPSKVTGLEANISPTFPEVHITWDETEGATGYVIERSEDGIQYDAISKVSGGNSVVDNNLPVDTVYSYRVVAYNNGGDAVPSDSVIIRTSATSEINFIAEESFESYPTGKVSGMNGPGGWAGAWNKGPCDVVDVSENPLTANGISGGDRALKLAYGDDVGRRQFANPVAGNNYGDGVWMSYLIRWESGSSDNTNSAWLFNSKGNRDWAFAGVTSNGAFAVSDWYNTGSASANNLIEIGQTVQVVVKITYNEMSLWIDPQSATEPPAVSRSVSNSKGWRNGFPGIGICARNNDVFLMDRLVVGRSFDAVMNGSSSVPADTFTTWTDNYTWDSEADKDYNADPDGDNLSNLAEFLHDTDPTKANSNPMKLKSVNSDSIEIAYSRRIGTTGYRTRIQSSTTLAPDSWLDVTPVATNSKIEDNHEVLTQLFAKEQNPLFLRIIYEKSE